MSKQIPGTRGEWIAWAKEVESKSPARFRFYVLALAAVLMVAHYTIDELAYHPEHSLWTAWFFWSGAWIYAAVPFINWFFLAVVEQASSLLTGRQDACPTTPALRDSVKTLKPILTMALVLCTGSALAFSVPSMLRSIEALHLHRFVPSIEKWHWSTFRFYWSYWTPAVLLTGNLVLLWHSRRGIIPQPLSQSGRLEARPTTSRVSLILKILAVTSATVACGVTAFHLVLPRVPANQDVIDLARSFLVEARLRNDLDYLIQHSFVKGQPLAPLLTHLELANLQRHQFYSSLDDRTFQEYILSPKIAPLPLEEVNWRRTFWENFYPRIRHETDPIEAAQIVVRFLRERVGIDPSYHYRVGVETIWTEQMTDEAGFDRIYVAALRSVGIASRLNDASQAELLEGDQWQPAPRVLISSFEDKKFPVPKGGLVNFRN